MRQLLLAVLILSFGFSNASAQDGYTLKLKLTDKTNQKVFLAHYYGKPLPTIYKVDSATVDAKGNAVLQSKNKIIGGLYLLIMEDNTHYFEFLLDNGQKLDMTATVAKMPLGVVFKNSEENTRFFKYVSFLNDIGERHQKLTAELAKANTKNDTVAVQDKFRALSVDVTNFRKDYIKNNPNTILANIFLALETPDVPAIKKDDGTEDMAARYKQYKEHYWDNIAFDDERLVYTPLLQAKLDEYFTRLVPSIPDTFNAEADMLVQKSRASKEMFKFIVHWLTNYAQESNLMGMDAVFVHMVETYYMKGEAFWLNSGTLEKYMERARNIAPNVIGNIAPSLEVKKKDNTDFKLSDFKAKYTLLVFWSPDCGHCEEEMPRIDSAIKADGLDKKGLKVVGFNIDKDINKWNEVIKNKQLNSWMHVYDPERTSKYRSQYDVYGTPSVYLLDEKKIIRGKKLDHSNISLIIKILEEEANASN